VKGLIRQAWERRAPLRERGDTDAYRLLHGWSEGLAGVEVDALGEVAEIVCKSADPGLLPELAAAVREVGGFAEVVARQRGKVPTEGETRSREVRELGVRYLVEPGNPRHHGLYLDARPARQWLAGASSERRIVNLFSFAGSLGVAAMAGGALSVVHVDSQKRALRRCRANHQLNDQRIDDRDLVRDDVYKWLGRCARSERRFGGIIIDPPPTPGRDALGDLRRLVERATAVLDSEGWLLLFLHRGIALDAALTGGLEVVWTGESGLDFPETDPGHKLRFAALRATL
jgi:23S rRNA (cytosine1962-C5)-methyltransferase